MELNKIEEKDDINCDNKKFENLNDNNKNNIFINKDSYYKTNEKTIDNEFWDKFILNYIKNIEYEPLPKHLNNNSSLNEENDINQINLDNIDNNSNIIHNNDNKIENLIPKSNIEKENKQNKDMKDIKEDPINKTKDEEIFFDDSNIIKENNINKISLDSFIFNGKKFKKYYRDNKYVKNNNIKRIVYKCVNHRKDERIIIYTNKTPFCNSTIEYIFPDKM